MRENTTQIQPRVRFRWTGARAALTLPGGAGVTLVVGGGRPAGTPPAEISVWVGEHPVLFYAEV